MKKSFILINLLFVVSCASTDISSSPCCGPITEQGKKLEYIMDKMDVEKLWSYQRHVNWETGVPDRPSDYQGPDRYSHCSAFAAAFGKKVNAYLLRPPEHEETFLASAQARWLRSDAGKKAGWNSLTHFKEAQQFANEGYFVIAVYESNDTYKPGHIAIVRPSLKSAEELQRVGPQVIQSGKTNKNSWDLKHAFANHPGAWPDKILFYVNNISI